MRSSSYFKNALFAFLVVNLFFTACTKNNPPIESSQVVQPYPYEYVLTKQTYGNIATQGMTMEYFYNANNKVESIKKYEWGKNDLNNPDYFWDDDTWFYFSYTNGLATRMSFNTPDSDDYVTYEYDATGRAIKSTWYSTRSYGDSGQAPTQVIPDFPYRMHTYRYDERGALVDDRDSLLETNQLAYRTVFEYGETGNALTKTSYSLLPYNAFKSRSYYLDYDEHVSYANMVNGLPLGGNFHDAEYSFGVNNYTREQISDGPIPLDVEFGAWSVLERRFEYNDAGLPVRIALNPDYGSHYIIDLEYKKITP